MEHENSMFEPVVQRWNALRIIGDNLSGCSVERALM